MKNKIVTTVGIVTIDSTGIIRSFDPVAEKLFGYQSNDVLGKNVSLLMPSPYQQEHDSYLKKHNEDQKTNVIGRGREVIGLRSDNTQFPIWLAVNKVTFGDEVLFVGSIADLSELKAAENELRMHRDDLEKLVSMRTAEVQAIVQTSVGGIITTNEQGIIRTFNPAAEKLFQWRSDEVIGANVSVLVGDEFIDHHDGYMQRYLETGRSQIVGKGREVKARRKDGSTFTAYIAIGHSRLDEHEHFFVASIRDITEEKENEAQLVKARQDAESAVQAKAAFMANMSHEIRTPMNAIIGFSELILKDNELSSESSRHLNTVLNSARSLMSIINDILDVSKLESGKFSLEQVRFHLPNAIADAMRTLEHRIAEKSLRFSFDYNENLPKRFFGDPTRLRQVILNLVGNAIKFTDKGNIALTVQPGNRPNSLHFSVSDTGIGMNEAQSKHIFEAFTQADGSTTRRFGGTGLGTTISKQIVELMDGNIWVESALGEGTTMHFDVVLIASETAGECLYENDTQYRQDVVSPRLFNILLVEDIEANAKLATLRLESLGHKITWVENGKLAVDAFKQGSFDLILMDIWMPEMDGLQATQAIRKIEASHHDNITIIALTASIMQEDKARCYAAGINAIQAKPIDFNSLLEEMENTVALGKGVPNNTIASALESRYQVDLSALEGQIKIDDVLDLWGDSLIYVKTLLNFIDKNQDSARTIADYLHETPPNLKAARAIAHALKGVAGNLCLTQINHLAAEIDKYLKGAMTSDTCIAQGYLQNVITNLEPLQMALNHLAQASSSLRDIVQQDSVTANAEAVDFHALKPQFEELYEACDNLDPDQAERLVAKLAEVLGSKLVKSINQAVSEFDFEQARACAEELYLLNTQDV